MDFKQNDSVALSRFVAFAKLLVMICDYPDTRYSESQFLKFSVKHQKRGLFQFAYSIWTYNHPRKTISFRKEGRGRSNPLTRGLPMDHAGVSAPIPTVIGFMVGCH